MTSFKVKSMTFPSCDRSLREEYNTLGLSHSVQCSTLATFRANWVEGLKGIPELLYSADDCKVGLSLSEVLVP